MKRILMTGMTAVLASGALAGDVLQWQDNSLSYLYGDNFEVDPGSQQTLTFEHVSGWNFGDVFAFVDGISFNGEDNSAGDSHTYYAEIAPRLSAGKLSGKDLSFGIVKDVLLATCYEIGDNDLKNYLVGPGFDLNIPGFDFFQVNCYRVWNESDESSFQITPVWKITQPVAITTIVFDGYIDWEFGNGRNNFHFNPQLTVDLGVYFGMDAGKLYAGAEYDYWTDKYAIDDGEYGLDTNQSAISALVKYHF